MRITPKKKIVKITIDREMVVKPKVKKESAKERAKEARSPSSRASSGSRRTHAASANRDRSGSTLNRGLGTPSTLRSASAAAINSSSFNPIPDRFLRAQRS